MIHVIRHNFVIYVFLLDLRIDEFFQIMILIVYDSVGCTELTLEGCRQISKSWGEALLITIFKR